MSNSASLPPIQNFAENRQLEGTSNFLAFSDSVVSTARGYGLEGYLNGSIPRPNVTTAPAVMAAGAAPGQPLVAVPTANNSTTPTTAEWDLRNARLAAIIFLNVKNPRGIGLSPTQTAEELWNRITAK
ncbi:hypothetical protein F5878DRAFT_506444, partial [Lentinula raphanica]